MPDINGTEVARMYVLAHDNAHDVFKANNFDDKEQSELSHWVAKFAVAHNFDHVHDDDTSTNDLHDLGMCIYEGLDRIAAGVQEFASKMDIIEGAISSIDFSKENEND